MPAAHALTPASLAPLLRDLGAPAYRGAQILSWVYARDVVDPGAMTDLPSDLREALGSAIEGESVTLARVERSSDGTAKLAIALADGQIVESVLIPDRHRLTLCISSQVGCGMGCAFCATARLGLKRNLSVAEIVGQVVVAKRVLAREAVGVGRITNLVFMGMGEPMHNLGEVIPAIDILTAQWGLGFSPRRITVSTVGLVAGMRRLLDETHVHLAVSLSATTEEGRRELMPVSRRYGLAELMETCRELPLPRRRRITFEYVMLADVNDADEDATRLVALLHGLRAKVNLIPFNPFPGAGFASSPRARIERFQRLLLDRGVNATVRESRGPDIAAACGQLAAEASGALAG